MEISPVTLVVSALKEDRPVIIVDDLGDSLCGYLAMASARITGEKVSLFVNLGRGVLLSAIEEKRASRMGIAPLGDLSRDPFPLGVGVESRLNITTGISAIERAETLRAIAREALANKTSQSRAIIAPGHVFPLIGKDGGLLVKTGIAEAILDLLTITGEEPVGAVMHILGRKGEYSSLDELRQLSEAGKFPMIFISQIINHRLGHEPLIHRVATAKLPTEHFGEFEAHCYVSKHDQGEHLVLSKNIIKNEDVQKPTLVRMHSERRTGDLFFDEAVPGRLNLLRSMRRIEEEGRGALVYIRKNKSGFSKGSLDGPGSSVSMPESIVALKELGVGAQILIDLGITNLRLLTSTIKSTPDLSAFSLNIHEQILL
ncbi:MAG TPA: 3,4-dihydroxy-2-butanone-4-phosphate synthase [Oligoflexia bacterium]|nr:3,4-dihydroxy-2-butanone-4-phosphate synthase [Oligoflexia bacterium]HMP49352.1 3,4-dihydroxy-2-butanone-4-phosphate synthase [Oligoflexia bacterium]